MTSEECWRENMQFVCRRDGGDLTMPVRKNGRTVRRPGNATVSTGRQVRPKVSS